MLGLDLSENTRRYCAGLLGQAGNLGDLNLSRFQTHKFWPSRSTVLESLLPAWSLARTTK